MTDDVEGPWRKPSDEVGYVDEGIWYRDPDDGADTPNYDDDEPAGEDAIELVWARAYHVHHRIEWLKQRLARQENIFEPTDDEDPEGELDELQDEWRDLSYEMRYRGYPPKGWKPSPTERVMSRVASKPPAFEDTLPDRLSADERQLWQWLMVEPRRQQDIAAELGLSQQAVAKRERKLRAKVDELYGKPYPWVPRQSPAGGRPRRS